MGKQGNLHMGSEGAQLGELSLNVVNLKIYSL